tara:strand:+ start:2616 stop:3041 length:426 start_codon:yes stop_codon:yes gene_type:complete
MLTAEFDIKIILLLLWGLISWLTKNKKKGSQTNINILKKQSNNNKLLSNKFNTLKTYFINELPSSRLKPKLINYNSLVKKQIIDVPEITLVAKNTKNILNTNKKLHWIKQGLYNKSNLKKIIIIKQILEKPYSIKSNTNHF